MNDINRNSPECQTLDIKSAAVELGVCEETVRRLVNVAGISLEVTINHWRRKFRVLITPYKHLCPLLACRRT
jgi:hypothetical protein